MPEMSGKNSVVFIHVRNMVKHKGTHTQTHYIIEQRFRALSPGAMSGRSSGSSEGIEKFV